MHLLKASKPAKSQIHLDLVQEWFSRWALTCFAVLDWEAEIQTGQSPTQRELSTHCQANNLSCLYLTGKRKHLIDFSSANILVQPRLFEVEKAHRHACIWLLWIQVLRSRELCKEQYSGGGWCFYLFSFSSSKVWNTARKNKHDS